MSVEAAAGQGERALREMQQRVRAMGGVIRCVARRTVETSRSLPVVLSDPLALLLHELAVEAVAGGALGDASGRLIVDWTVDGDAAGARRLLLGWRETGLKERRPPTNFDFARVLLDYMASRGAAPEADETASDGLRLCLRLPLSAAGT